MIDNFIKTHSNELGFLNGSRFWGWHNENSDWDYMQSIKYLSDLLEIGFYVSKDTSDIEDVKLLVYHSTYPIHVALIDECDLSDLLKIRDTIKDIPYYKNLGGIDKAAIWNKLKEENTKMKLCLNCKGAITYDAGGKEYCATNGCTGPIAKFTNKATQLAGVCGSCNQDLQALAMVGSWGCKTPQCRNYGLEFVKFTVEDVVEVKAEKVESVEILKNKTKRLPVDYLYTCLDWSFIRAMAKVGHRSATKREENMAWIPGYMEKPHTGDKAPINHLVNHTTDYILRKNHPMGCPKWHLVAIAWNAMMEFFWYEKGEAKETNCQQSNTVSHE